MLSENLPFNEPSSSILLFPEFPVLSLLSDLYSVVSDFSLSFDFSLPCFVTLTLPLEHCEISTLSAEELTQS